MKESNFGKQFEQREGEERFDWHDYVQKPEEMPPAFAEKLDEMVNLVNGGGIEAEQFISALKNGQYRKPLLSLVQFFRDILEPNEKKELFDAVEKCEPTGGKFNHKTQDFA